MISAYLTAVIPGLLLPWVLIPLGSPILFALLPVAPVAFVYARLLTQGRTGHALAVATLWALAISVSTVTAGVVLAEGASRAIWHADAYRDEMLAWVATGQGAEGHIALFLPRVLGEYALVLLLSAGTMGAGALLLGGLLLGYMNAYVGWVVSHADPHVHPLAAALIAWPPWAVCRVLAFIAGATAAARWGYPRWFARQAPRESVARLLGASAALLLADIGLKWWLAPLWRDFLRALLGASAGIEAGGSG
jgi:hypothetical protein